MPNIIRVGGGKVGNYNLQLKLPPTSEIVNLTSGRTYSFDVPEADFEGCKPAKSVSVGVNYSSSHEGLSGVNRDSSGAATIGDHAIFAGGSYINYSYTTNNSNLVDAYNKELVRSSPEVLSNYVECAKATTIGNYALFSGSNVKSVDVYNKELVHSTAEDRTGASFCAAASVGNYALFSGNKKLVDVYNTELIHSTMENQTVKSGCVATSVGEYALFGGGGSSTAKKVDAYNKELVRSAAPDLSLSEYQASEYMSAVSTSDYALFGGGSNVDGNNDQYYYNNTVSAYNKELIKSTTSLGGQGREGIGTSSFKGGAIFTGGFFYDNSTDDEGYTIGTTYVHKACFFNNELVMSAIDGSVDYPVGNEGNYMSGTEIGDYALIGCNKLNAYTLVKF